MSSESILDKKLRLFGNLPDNDPAVLRAVRSGAWTAQDAIELRRHMEKSGMLAVKRGRLTGEMTYAERVAGMTRKVT